MRLTEACDWHSNPDANSDRYTHFDPTLSVDGGRVIDCTGDPDLLSTAAVADAIERRSSGLCAAELPRNRWPATTNGKGKQ